MANTPEHLFNKTMIVSGSSVTLDEFNCPTTIYSDSGDIKCRLSQASANTLALYQKLNSLSVFTIYTYPDLAISTSDTITIEDVTYRILGLKIDSNKVMMSIDVEKTPYEQ